MKDYMIKSQGPNKKYRDGWDRVFNKKEEKEDNMSKFKVGDKVKITHDIGNWSGITGDVVRIVGPYTFISPDVNQKHNTRLSDGLLSYYRSTDGAGFLHKNMELVSAPVGSVDKSTKEVIPISMTVAVIDTIETFVALGQSFSCYDVTKTLINRGFSPVHNNVRDFIHALKADEAALFGCWTRHTVRLAKYNLSTEVYAADDAGAVFYNPDTVKLNSSTSPSTPGVVVPSTTQKRTIRTVTAPTVKVVVGKPKIARPKLTGTKRDARGRLCIPNATVRKLGMKRGETCYITKSGKTLTIMSTANPKDKHIAALVVDRSDNIRVTRKTLEKAGMDKSASLTISLVPNGKSIFIA